MQINNDIFITIKETHYGSDQYNLLHEELLLVSSSTGVFIWKKMAESNLKTNTSREKERERNKKVQNHIYISSRVGFCHFLPYENTC